MKSKADLWKVMLIYGMIGVIFNIYVIINHRVFYFHHYFLNLLVIPFYSIVGILFYNMFRHIKLNKKNFIVIVILLFIVDQGIKLFLMKTHFIQYPVMLISNWLYIDPQFNPWGSFIGNLLGTKIPFLGLLEFLSFPLLILMYRFSILELKADLFSIKVFLLFGIAGALAGFIDTTFFGTSYDFVTLNGMLKFDLKDMYLEFAKASLLLSLFIKRPFRETIGVFKKSSLKNYIKIETEIIKNMRKKN